MSRPKIHGGRYSESYTDQHGVVHTDYYIIMLEPELRPAQAIGRGQTINHEPIPDDALEFAVMAAIYRATKSGDRDKRSTDSIGGGQSIDSLRKVGTPKALHQADLWERWHLNGMKAGCAHQGATWTCTNDLNETIRIAAVKTGPDAIAQAMIRAAIPVKTCNTENGWPAVRAKFGEHPYPKNGTDCMTCGRYRSNEPTDWCSFTGYRYGTAWLYEPIPADVLADIFVSFLL